MRKVLFYIAASLSLALAGAKAVGLAITYAEDPAGLDTFYAIRQIVYVLALAIAAAVLWSKRDIDEGR